MGKARIFLMLFLCSIFLGACELTDDGDYVNPITNYEKISGTWNLKAVKEIDEIAKVNLTKPYEFIITTELTFTTFQIILNTDEDFNPTSFEVLGTAPKLFLTSGYWKLDNPFVNTDGSATSILLYSDIEKTQLVDKLSLAKIPGTSSQMEFKLTRSAAGTPYVSYYYTLAHPVSK